MILPWTWGSSFESYCLGVESHPGIIPCCKQHTATSAAMSSRSQKRYISVQEERGFLDFVSIPRDRTLQHWYVTTSVSLRNPDYSTVKTKAFVVTRRSHVHCASRAEKVVDQHQCLLVDRGGCYMLIFSRSLLTTPQRHWLHYGIKSTKRRWVIYLPTRRFVFRRNVNEVFLEIPFSAPGQSR